MWAHTARNFNAELSSLVSKGSMIRCGHPPLLSGVTGALPFLFFTDGSWLRKQNMYEVQVSKLTQVYYIFHYYYYFIIIIYSKFVPGTWPSYLMVLLSLRLAGTAGARMNVKSSYSQQNGADLGSCGWKLSAFNDWAIPLSHNALPTELSHYPIVFYPLSYPAIP